MAIEGVGGALLRVQGDGGSLGDARRIAHALLHDEAFRARATALGGLVTGLEEDERHNAALSLLRVVVGDLDAPSSPRTLRGTSLAFAHTEMPLGLALRQARVSWLAHIDAVGDKIFVSRALESIIDGVGALWATHLGLRHAERFVSEGEEG